MSCLFQPATLLAATARVCARSAPA
jgi:hypothetical protein